MRCVCAVCVVEARGIGVVWVGSGGVGPGLGGTYSALSYLLCCLGCLLNLWIWKDRDSNILFATLQYSLGNLWSGVLNSSILHINKMWAFVG